VGRGMRIKLPVRELPNGLLDKGETIDDTSRKKRSLVAYYAIVIDGKGGQPIMDSRIHTAMDCLSLKPLPGAKHPFPPQS
jgi:hypothetical protein